MACKTGATASAYDWRCGNSYRWGQARIEVNAILADSTSVKLPMTSTSRRPQPPEGRATVRLPSPYTERQRATL